MLIAVLSDIHSNLPALEAVMTAVDRDRPDEIHCLGDVVGYGADPEPCIDIIRRRCTTVVLGNHDLAVADGSGMKLLPPHGRIAAEHNASKLSAEDRHWLANLPLTAASANATFVHASPHDPDSWTRIESFPIAQVQFEYFDTDVCFIGHSHVPAVLADRVGVFNVRAGYRFLINV
ncbi:MAG: metallophosphoesterase, partial [Rhodothermales bacterium]|nr:metallophosphoesterase [Rhodothermales bacterium]